MPYVGAGAPLHEQYVQRLPLHELWWRLLEPYKQPECPTHVMVTAAELPSFNATSGSFSDMKGNQTSRMGVYERTEHLEAPPARLLGCYVSKYVVPLRAIPLAWAHQRVITEGVHGRPAGWTETVFLQNPLTQPTLQTHSVKRQLDSSVFLGRKCS